MKIRLIVDARRFKRTSRWSAVENVVLPRIAFEGGPMPMSRKAKTGGAARATVRATARTHILGRVRSRPLRQGATSSTSSRARTACFTHKAGNNSMKKCFCHNTVSYTKSECRKNGADDDARGKDAASRSKGATAMFARMCSLRIRCPSAPTCPRTTTRKRTST